MERVADQVVTFGAVPPATAGECVVCITVHYPIAERAEVVDLCERNAQPSLEHDSVESWRDACVERA